MHKFVHIEPQHYDFVNHLYLKYQKYLEDDFNQDTLAGLICRTSPFCWLIIDECNSCAGFVYLDNIIGNNNNLYSAEITTCFHPDYWGKFTKICALDFIDICFNYFQFSKLKVLVYPQNFRVTNLIKTCGFEKEALLVAETVKNGLPQNIEVYSLLKEKYKERKNEY